MATPSLEKRATCDAAAEKPEGTGQGHDEIRLLHQEYGFNPELELADEDPPMSPSPDTFSDKREY